MDGELYIVERKSRRAKRWRPLTMSTEQRVADMHYVQQRNSLLAQNANQKDPRERFEIRQSIYRRVE